MGENNFSNINSSSLGEIKSSLNINSYDSARQLTNPFSSTGGTSRTITIDLSQFLEVPVKEYERKELGIIEDNSPKEQLTHENITYSNYNKTITTANNHTLTFDENGRVIQEVNENGETIARYKYEENGANTHIRENLLDGSISYYENGKIIYTQNKDGATTEKYIYGPNGELQSYNKYDDNGNHEYTTNVSYTRNSERIETTVNAGGDLTKKITYNSNGTINTVEDYKNNTATYYENGRPIQTKNI